MRKKMKVCLARKASATMVVRTIKPSLPLLLLGRTYIVLQVKLGYQNLINQKKVSRKQKSHVAMKGHSVK